MLRQIICMLRYLSSCVSTRQSTINIDFHHSAQQQRVLQSFISSSSSSIQQQHHHHSQQQRQCSTTVIRLFRNCMIILYVLSNCCRTVHSFSLPIIPPNQNTLSSNKHIFTRFQFDANGICIVPKLFVEERRQQQQQQQQQQQSEHQLRYYTMQNVPGDGDCVFLAVALATISSMGFWNYNNTYSASGSNINNADGTNTPKSTNLFRIDDLLLRTVAYNIRNVVADILQSTPRTDDNNNSTLLHITQNRTISTNHLLQQASYELKITPTQYISLLRKEGRHNGLFGGGPELTILSNILRRPITIYEIDYNKTFDLTHNGNSGNATEYNNRNDNIVNTHLTTENDTIYIVAKGTFGEGIFHDPLSRCKTSNNTTDNTNIIQQISNWHVHILIVDVSDNTKHACVLHPQQHLSLFETRIR